MDKLIKLNRWLLFELICTVGAFGYFLNVAERAVGRGGLGDSVYFGIILFFIARTFFLGMAWWSLYDGAWKTVKATDDGTPADSTSADYSEG